MPAPPIMDRYWQGTDVSAAICCNCFAYRGIWVSVPKASKSICRGKVDLSFFSQIESNSGTPYSRHSHRVVMHWPTTHPLVHLQGLRDSPPVTGPSHGPPQEWNRLKKESDDWLSSKHLESFANSGAWPLSQLFWIHCLECNPSRNIDKVNKHKLCRWF